jgi:hypothetical protein
MFGPHIFLKLVVMLNHSENFLFSVTFNLDPWTTKAPIKSVPGDFFSGQSGQSLKLTTPSGAEVKN